MPILLAALLSALVGVACGLSSALFLWLLEGVTATRHNHPWLAWLLPVGGVFLGLAIVRFATPVKGGTNLVLARIRDGGPSIPVRIVPVVLLGTLWTHLFGGSAGREGTAVQMGGGLAEFVARRFGVSDELRRRLLRAGVAGGFGSVFGTPLAGALFAIEFVTPSRPRFDGLPHALVAAFVGDLVSHACGTIHTPYPHVDGPALSLGLPVKWLLFGAIVALVVAAFIELAHLVKRTGERFVASIPRRMAVGGAVAVGLWLLAGTDDYLGLGVPTIVRAFTDPSLEPAAFAWKLVFTAVTVGNGFVGGEVTPLFFIGATLGNALAPLLDVPLGLSVGIGLAAMFGAASNAPFALSVMAAELMGWAIFPHVLVVSLVATWLKRRRSIYPEQLVPSPPHP